MFAKNGVKIPPINLLNINEVWYLLAFYAWAVDPGKVD